MTNRLPFRFFITHPKVIVLEWDGEPDDTMLQQLIEFKKRIIKEFDEVIQITQGYLSLMLFHKINVQDIEDYKNKLYFLYSFQSRPTIKKVKVWQIPVCYEETYAPDLKSLASKLNLNTTALIKKHVSALYQVYFIGFLPGFLYLNGLAKELEYSRKEQPLTNVPQGSVAIGGKQTGIYPMDSPGGWHIIGKTPYPFFDPKNKKPCFAQTGDSVQFISISKSEFLKLEMQRLQGTLKISHL
tara:strand:+ start:481 stop:1203 length:723 start_codon:yes stop_codon:yes gene_type:complete